MPVPALPTNLKLGEQSNNSLSTWTTLFTTIASDSEDNLRQLNVKYGNKITELRTNQSVSNSILSLQMRATSIVGHQLYNRNFWIKNLILFELDKSYKKYFTNRKLNYQWDIKNNLIDNKYLIGNLIFIISLSHPRFIKINLPSLIKKGVIKW